MTDSKFIPLYDLESLNEQQRQDYVRAVCQHMGVPSELNLVMLTYLDETDGPRRLVAYAKRGATEIIRNNRGISVTDLTSKEVGGSIVFTATGKDNIGRQEMSTGSKWIQGLAGRELDDAIMTAQTRATRRMTLQFVGAGVLDESEVNPANTVQLKESNPAPPPPQPLAAPASAPGRDVTEQQVVNARLDAITASGTPQEQQLAFEAQQAKLRQEAIAALNANHAPAEAAPTKRRGRKPRNTVDLGPSAPVSVNPPVSAVVETPKISEIPMQPVSVATPAPQPIAVAPVAPGKPRLTPEQVRPFRQRLFKIVNDQLEPNGFAPKEGIGNQDKMRQFATLMFPEVQSMNELTETQWEKYLSTLEQKIQKEGTATTIKYIEDSIGI
jgi:hypothetical protein